MAFQIYDISLKLPLHDNIPTDYAHHGKKFKTVDWKTQSTRSVDWISETFESSEKNAPGIALTECSYPYRMVDPYQSFWCAFAPPHTQTWLSLEWPGYEQLRHKEPIYLVHPDGLSYTKAEVAIQVASHMHKIYQCFVNSFMAPGIRLGPNDVPFENIRLLELSTKDGIVWYPKMAYLDRGQ